MRDKILLLFLLLSWCMIFFNFYFSGYKISPKPCRVAGPGGGSSQLGTCMFVWECIKSEGIHVGICVDTFMFGSCCIKNETRTTTVTSFGDSSSLFEPSRLSDTTPSVVTTLKVNETSERVTSRPRPIYASHTNRPKRPSSHEFQSSPARLPDDGKNQMADEEDETNQRMRPSENYGHDVNKPEKATFPNVPPLPPPPPPPAPPVTNINYSSDKEEDNVISNVSICSIINITYYFEVIMKLAKHIFE